MLKEPTSSRGLDCVPVLKTNLPERVVDHHYYYRVAKKSNYQYNAWAPNLDRHLLVQTLCLYHTRRRMCDFATLRSEGTEHNRSRIPSYFQPIMLFLTNKCCFHFLDLGSGEPPSSLRPDDEGEQLARCSRIQAAECRTRSKD